MYRLPALFLLLLSSCSPAYAANAAVVALRELVQSGAPRLTIPSPGSDAGFSSCATQLIVRWEVTSPKTYQKRYQGVIWPGGHSGPTWGVGYDGGVTTRRDIQVDWREHPAVDRLVSTSGVTGQEARVRVSRLEWAGIQTSFASAQQVFSTSTLPTYSVSARRAFGPGFVSLPTGARCALTSLVYNRGGGMSGNRRAEMRAIRDVCVPAQDAVCVAAQLRAMARLWPETPGLQNRRYDEARVARQ